MKKTIVLLMLGAAGAAFAAPLFEGKDGLLVMEVESTSSSKGSWKERDTVPGFTGSCHFEFTGNQPASGPAKNPLKYYFTVDKDGVYKLLIRCHKRLEDEKPDKCNDCYVRLEGDFAAGGPAPLALLKADTKLYGGSPTGWGWSAQLDKGHKKFPPLYKLKAGVEYTLVISGRSQRFNMDRIVFRHADVPDGKARDPKIPESKSRKK